MIVGFIDEYRQVYGVESICRALSAYGVQIAPRTYRKARHRPASDREITDAPVENAPRDLQNTPEAMYGRRKMTHYLRRHGHEVAFCTVDRILHSRPVDAEAESQWRGQRPQTPDHDPSKGRDTCW
ncbi:hypothetical protein [Nocardia brevicatena]|uniref:hypothetical protein n=1 Tax=Nocardia brevicatena TaxID=37327 RepID=UPI0002FA73FC|nr:hypothetical protein [Nocardia brevicatena]